MSCTKSYFAVLIGILADEGAIKLDEAIEHFLPKFARSGFAEGTIRQHIDMAVGIHFVEDYAVG